MAEKPMTKAEARAFLKRAREGLRDAEEALRTGDAADLQEALIEVTGAACHVQDALESAPYAEPRGIRGVA